MGEAKKAVIVLVAFNRPGLLSDTLKSIQRANLGALPLVVIHQKGNQQVLDLLQQSLSTRDYLFQVSGQDRSTIHNISFNRILGYQFAFDFLKADYVFGFEDDILVSPDIFLFSDYIFRKYDEIRRFRGINFGSHEALKLDLVNSYSLQRFGIHGPASAISARTFKHFKEKSLQERSRNLLFDGIFEPFIRSGFMITPTVSRFLDTGVGGTHTSGDASDAYFRKMEQSFLREAVTEEYFCVEKLTHSWRADVFEYRKRDNLLFDVLCFLGERRANPVFLKLERAIYKAFILPRLILD